jgi:cytoskeletal protein CcmA (bactofilin family)
MLEIESPIQASHRRSAPNGHHSAQPESTSPRDAAFDPAAYFDRWFADVHANGHPHSRDVASNEEIYFESARGSSCEVNFEGVLHFDGYTLGNIRSPDGTLVLAKAGRVDADIDVSRAVISGAVTGNINAPEGVVLDSDARVSGQIHTRMLSVRVGALFEGDCLFVAATDSSVLEKSAGVEWLDKH